ncbi:MAG: helix-turn-helix domain-containing protein [Betaproteobacteria bacterium]|nr:helix-turn-helix domain-containing protein [Betaproteobacteria bacterium]
MIGHRIKEARDAAKLSQAELARVIGVSQPTVSDWESLKTAPTTDNMSMAAIVLCVRFEWLATGRGEMRYVEGVQEYAAPYQVVAPPPDQVELLNIYMQLTQKRRQALIEFIKKWG